MFFRIGGSLLATIASTYFIFGRIHAGRLELRELDHELLENSGSQRLRDSALLLTLM